LYDYFHAKLDATDEESDFDIAQISDVSDDETNVSQEGSNSEPNDSGETTELFTQDEEMTDAHCTKESEGNPAEIPHFDSTTNQLSRKTEDHNKPPPNNHPDQHPKTNDPPLSWDSDSDNEEVHPPQNSSEPQWTTTPSRLKSSPAETTDKSNRIRSSSRASARNLYKQAFPTLTQDNRFSPLEDETPIEDMDTTMNSTESPSSQQDEATFHQESTDEDSLDDSVDGMSLVSTKELEDLARDSAKFDEDEYDTDTTANTSPSKASKKSQRKSSTYARHRISELYTSKDALFGNLWNGADGDSEFITTSLNLPPHLSLNTPTTSEGTGEDTT
jgi:hypothetical protein